jgi:hypothetical protein
LDSVPLVDADDVIPEGNQGEWWKLKAELSYDIDVVVIPYHLLYDSDGKPTSSIQRERVAKNSPLIMWEDPVH